MNTFDSYDKYQLRWLINHEHSLFDLIKEVSRYAEEYEGDDKDKLSIVDYFKMWEMEQGFNGELYACFGEWDCCEFVDDSVDNDIPKSAYRGDYSPSCPWGAEGMSIHDFI